MKKPLIVSSLLVACLGASLAVAGENWIGTWKLNAAKSQPGANALSAETLKFEATPAGRQTVLEGADAQGKPVHGWIHLEVRRHASALDRQSDGGHGRAQEDRRQQLREHLEARPARAP